MIVTVVGVFDSMRLAERAREALLLAGVQEQRIGLSVRLDVYVLGVQAQSSLERQRIEDLLRRAGANRTDQRSD
jgi:hypothetical protein